MQRKLWRMCFKGKRMLPCWSLPTTWVATTEDSSMPLAIRTSPLKCRIVRCWTIFVISRWLHSWSLRRVSTEQTCDWLSRWKRERARLIPISKRCSNWIGSMAGVSLSSWCPASLSVRESANRSRWWANTSQQNMANAYRALSMIVRSWRR